MATGTELITADTWLYATLTGDAQLTGLLADAESVWPDQAPDGAGGPLIIYQAQSDGTDRYVVGTTRLWTDPVYVVKAVVEGTSYLDAEPIAARIDQLLHGRQALLADGELYECHRIGPFRLPEDTPTVKYRHLGGLYRLKVT